MLKLTNSENDISATSFFVKMHWNVEEVDLDSDLPYQPGSKALFFSDKLVLPLENHSFSQSPG